MTYEITAEQLETIRAALIAAEDQLEEGSKSEKLRQKRLEMVWEGITILDHAPQV